ncbi:MAG: hypothetical protein IRZ21_00715 [Thermoleophilaceae bacterium]|nr:hypothetical protein [Thermoleophilaceae bacterium]
MPSPCPDPASAPDPDSRAWLAALSGGDERERARAAGRLRSLVARAVRDGLRGRGERDPDLAAEAAEAAFERLRASLDAYDGSSRFTVFAASFAFAELARTLGGARSPDCRDCLAAIAEHVEIELVGGSPGGAMPALEAHLGACPGCADAREGLHDFALRRA